MSSNTVIAKWLNKKAKDATSVKDEVDLVALQRSVTIADNTISYINIMTIDARQVLKQITTDDPDAYIIMIDALKEALDSIKVEPEPVVEEEPVEEEPVEEEPVIDEPDLGV